MKTIAAVIEEMQKVCLNVDAEEYASSVQLLKEDRRFFFTGEGRSGFVAKAIAMRLMHSGKTVYVVGETTTPAIQETDILVVLSGSGKTAQALNISESAHRAGATVFLITTNEEALQLPFISGGVRIPAATKYRHVDEPETIQPLGNQFDQAAHLILDAAIIDSLAEGKTNEELVKKHSNLE
ncbi:MULTISPECIES: 6-phospho-3-hexuloisomerase [unclassified Mesobacillus]|uniref:6-phospho-3-hexuloisomerase n=1 Tax=unclassified Mesobacillus TaxID=2675270 RepID=UPI00203DFE9E|nr:MULTISPECIES: 6-phospho-3-hexuloisomerase [unclassified Mesobacillus]MCM3124215.1 SIS domain-containing protein [Mesobacillus sp. MER 33]MCM3234064.1 SIS domain-containing protein [Mesobacillus sp. MER 48]